MYSETTFKKQWFRQTNPNDSLNHFPFYRQGNWGPEALLDLPPGPG